MTEKNYVGKCPFCDLGERAFVIKRNERGVLKIDEKYECALIHDERYNLLGDYKETVIERGEGCIIPKIYKMCIEIEKYLQ